MVIEQLTEYCDCVEAKESDINELISLISLQTCWADKSDPCGTFLTGERKEVVDVPDCMCDCDVFTFDPLYSPFDPESFAFTLIEQEGIAETATEITDFTYSVIDENFKMQLPLPSCGCNAKCGCDKKYKLLVTYIAGYDEIPDCLLPVFCEALQWIKEKNTCDCSECEPCKGKEPEYGDINYTTLTGRLQDYFLTVLTQQYIKQIMLISVCRECHGMWAVVV